MEEKSPRFIPVPPVSPCSATWVVVLRGTCTHGNSDSLTLQRLEREHWKSLLKKPKFHATLWKLNILRELNMVSFPKFLTGSDHLSRKDSPGLPLLGGRFSHPHIRLSSISMGTLEPLVYVSFSPAQDRRHAAESTYIFVILRQHLRGVLSLYISQWIGWFSWVSLSFALGSLLLHDIALAVADLWVGIRWWEYLPMYCVIGSGNSP